MGNIRGNLVKSQRNSIPNRILAKNRIALEALHRKGILEPDGVPCASAAEMTASARKFQQKKDYARAALAREMNATFHLASGDKLIALREYLHAGRLWFKASETAPDATACEELRACGMQAMGMAFEAACSVDWLKKMSSSYIQAHLRSTMCRDDMLRIISYCALSFALSHESDAEYNHDRILNGEKFMQRAKKALEKTDDIAINAKAGFNESEMELAVYYHELAMKSISHKDRSPQSKE